MHLSLEEQVKQAQSGDREALEQIVGAIQGKIYGLALRMLWHPEDAKDAVQEILIRVITHLGSFRGQSGFMTWVYRVSANALLTIRRSRLEEAGLTFQVFERDLGEGISDAPVAVDPGLDEALLLEEVKVGCTQAMLLCLDRPHRLSSSWGRSWNWKVKKLPKSSEPHLLPFENGYPGPVGRSSASCSENVG